jgi:hypothetical protein
MTAESGAQPGISAEALYKKVGFVPHSQGQSDYLYSKVRFNVPCCGRRWGKSQAAGHRMTFKSFIPDSWNWIVGTSYRIGEKEFRVVWDDYQKLDLLRYCKKAYSQHQGEMYIKTPWGSTVMVVSADNPDSLLGEGLSHVIMSEAAKHNRATWEQYIEPALSDLRGSCDFPSTPQGFNWYHGMYMLGQLHTIAPPTNNPEHLKQFDDAKDYRSWRFPTWTNSVRYPGGIDDPEIRRVQRVASPIWFEQEYGAKFTALTGSIYEEWKENIHVLKSDEYQYNPEWTNHLTFDYGFNNPFVALDIQIKPPAASLNGIPGTDGPTAIVWREYYKAYMSTLEHAYYLRDRANPPGYTIDSCWGDPRGADEAAILGQVFRYPASEDVRWKLSVEQIKRMLSARPPKLLVHESCTNLIRQMSNLHVKDVGKNAKMDLQELAGDGNIQHKVDDHAADALRYFIGPWFVNGAGTSVEDIYGEMYQGSESEDFFTLTTSMTMGADDLFRVRL